MDLYGLGRSSCYPTMSAVLATQESSGHDLVKCFQCVPVDYSPRPSGMAVAQTDRSGSRRGVCQYQLGCLSGRAAAAGSAAQTDGIRTIGLWTLFATAAKLFVIDLAQVAAIWRILLFLEFGRMFLFLSYYVRTPAKEDSAEESARGI